MAQDYEIKVKVTGVDQAKTQVDGLTDSMDEAGDSGSQSFGMLDKVLGGLPSKLKAGAAGVRSMVVGMKTLRGAVMATGIGALVVAVVSLIQYFKRTERGAQQLRVITATLGAVMDKLMDSVISVGEFIFEAFNNPRETIKGLANDIQTFVISKVEQLMEGLGLLGTAIQQAFAGDFSAASATAAEGLTKVGDSVLALNPATAVLYQVAESVGEIAVEATASAKAAGALEKRMNDLMVSEREHLKVRAETNKRIAENRLAVEDETKSFDERISKLNEAIKLEEQTLAKELEFASERAEILRKQAKLAESDEETKQAVAEAEAKVIEIETQSLKQRKRLEGERQSLIKQRTSETEAAAAAIIKAEEEVQKVLDESALSRKDERTREEAAARKAYEERSEKAKNNAELLAQVEEEYRETLIAIDDKYQAQAKAKEDEANKKRAAAQKAVMDTLAEQQRTAREQELFDLEEQYNTLAEQAGENAELVAEVEAARLAARREMFERHYDEDQALNKENNEKKAADDKAAAQELMDIRVKSAKDTFSVLSSLNELFSKGGVEQNKKAFNRNKGIAIAETLVDTFVSAQKAFKSQLTATPDSPIRAAIAAAAATASGLARVAAIKSTQFNSGGGGGGGAAGGGGMGGGVQSVGVDVGTLIPNQQTPTPEPVRAYVVENEISNKQALNRELQIQTTL